MSTPELMEVPPGMSAKEIVRIAATGDLHCTRRSQGALQPIFEQAAQAADALVLTGDLTDYGMPEEAHILAREYMAVNTKMPVVAVLGNHDYESGHAEEIKDILAEAGMKVLDGEAVEINGVGFAGVKGFAGGYGRATVGAWGEPIIKQFVHAAIEEALKLESALARLTTPQRIALMHYSPVAATVEGELPEISAFLGTSRLEEPLMRYPVSMVFHGHAHKGALEGLTLNGIPVYNVAMPLLRKLRPGEPPFRVVDLSGLPALNRE